MTKITTQFAGLIALALAASAQAAQISASALFAAYERNEVVAEDDYNGRRIDISGRVSEIKDATMGGTIVFLAAGKNDRNIRCHFPKHAKSELAGLRVGEQATFACTVDYRVNNSIHASSCNRD
jgi:hypothetical protein